LTNTIVIYNSIYHKDQKQQIDFLCILLILQAAIFILQTSGGFSSHKALSLQ